MEYKRFCRKCNQYIAHDEYFGYCIKYNSQARHNDTCEVIIEAMVDE